MLDLFTVTTVFAQTGDASDNVGRFMSRVTQHIINPLIALLFALALLIFLWGMFSFLTQRDKDSDAANDGKRHMLWGIIGMFIMFAVFGIMNLIVDTLGADEIRDVRGGPDSVIIE